MSAGRRGVEGGNTERRETASQKERDGILSSRIINHAPTEPGRLGRTFRERTAWCSQEGWALVAPRLPAPVEIFRPRHGMEVKLPNFKAPYGLLTGEEEKLKLKGTSPNI